MERNDIEFGRRSGLPREVLDDDERRELKLNDERSEEFREAGRRANRIRQTLAEVPTGSEIAKEREEQLRMLEEIRRRQAEQVRDGSARSTEGMKWNRGLAQAENGEKPQSMDKIRMEDVDGIWGTMRPRVRRTRLTNNGILGAERNNAGHRSERASVDMTDTEKASEKGESAGKELGGWSFADGGEGLVDAPDALESLRRDNRGEENRVEVDEDGEGKVDDGEEQVFPEGDERIGENNTRGEEVGELSPEQEHEELVGRVKNEINKNPNAKKKIGKKILAWIGVGILGVGIGFGAWKLQNKGATNASTTSQPPVRTAVTAETTPMPNAEELPVNLGGGDYYIPPVVEDDSAESFAVIDEPEATPVATGVPENTPAGFTFTSVEERTGQEEREQERAEFVSLGFIETNNGAVEMFEFNGE